MKTHLSSVLAILTVSVAVGVNGAPPVANSATATTESTAGAFSPSPIGGPMNPEPVWGQMPPGAVVGMLSPDAFPGPLTPGSAFVNGIPGGSLYFDPSGTLHNPALIAAPGGTLSGSGVGGVRTSVVEADTARMRLFGPPPYRWQNLPFKTEIPAAARPLQSNATPTELYRSLEERDMARIESLVREGGLRPARQSEARFDDQMSPAQSFQPGVSFSGDQINMLKTFLR